MYNLTNVQKLELIEAATSGRRRTTCPVCLGGASSEKSLSLSTTQNGILYKCHRAKCDLRPGILYNDVGRTFAGLIPEDKPPIRVHDLPNVIMALLDSLSEAESAPLYDVVNKFRLEWTHDILVELRPDKGRICWPVYSPLGYIRGYVRRSYFGHAPKALNYLFDDSAALCWMRNYRDNTVTGWPRVVLVEDVPSARRLAEVGVLSVALLGSHISKEALSELLTYTDSVVVALDADATNKAFKLQAKYGAFFRNCRVAVLTGPDIKEMTYEELEYWLRENCLLVY